MPKYYMIQIDFEYITNSTGHGFDTRKTRAARLKPEDLPAMREVLERNKITSVHAVPTSYKPSGTLFLDPYRWEKNRERHLRGEDWL